VYVLEQPVFECAAVLKLEAAGFSGESCPTGRRRATNSLTRVVSIIEAKAGAVLEASHSK
jgi:hypothetical protein